MHRQREPLHLPPMIPCPNCLDRIPIDESYAAQYFKGVSLTCERCGETDRFEAARAAIEENFFSNTAFSFVGAISSHFEIELNPGERTTYRYSDHDIPSNARILFVNYTPQGSGGGGAFMPLETHGNVATRLRRNDAVTVWPMPLGEPTNGNKVGVFVTWVPSTSHDDSWLQLVDAFKSYADDDYASAIVPSNVAVEASLTKFLTIYLLSFSGRDRIERFLQDGATYSHQLNVVLPMIAKLTGQVTLPDQIRGSLNKLRSHRNAIAHTGTTEYQIEKPEAAELLTSALFGFRYVQLLEDALIRMG